MPILMMHYICILVTEEMTVVDLLVDGQFVDDHMLVMIFTVGRTGVSYQNPLCELFSPE